MVRLLGKLAGLAEPRTSAAMMKVYRCQSLFTGANGQEQLTSTIARVARIRTSF